MHFSGLINWTDIISPEWCWSNRAEFQNKLILPKHQDTVALKYFWSPRHDSEIWSLLAKIFWSLLSHSWNILITISKDTCTGVVFRSYSYGTSESLMLALYDICALLASLCSCSYRRSMPEHIFMESGISCIACCLSLRGDRIINRSALPSGLFNFLMKF